MSTEPTRLDDISAEELLASYDATAEALEQSSEEKAAGLMTNEILLRAYERTIGERGNAEIGALLAEIRRRDLHL